MNEWTVQEEKLTDKSLVYNVIGPEKIKFACITKAAANSIADALNKGTVGVTAG